MRPRYDRGCGNVVSCFFFFFFPSRRRHTRCSRDWSSDVCSSDLMPLRCACLQKFRGFRLHRKKKTPNKQQPLLTTTIAKNNHKQKPLQTTNYKKKHQITLRKQQPIQTITIANNTYPQPTQADNNNKKNTNDDLKKKGSQNQPQEHNDRK